MTAVPRAPLVAIGIGNPLRHDDGIGPAAIEVLAGRGGLPAGVDLVVLDGEVARLVDAWRGRCRAVVVDAARAGSPAGTVHRLATDRVGVAAGGDPFPGWAGAPSSHSAGLAGAVALARVLDALPDHLVVLGVEAADLSLGEGLSPPVRAVVPVLVQRIEAELVAPFQPVGTGGARAGVARRQP